MYISALRKSPAFSSPVVWSKPENVLDEDMKYHVDYFEYHPDRYQKLGEGKCASVHVLVPDKYVIKRVKRENFPAYDRFENETNALSLIPDTFEHSQHLFANTRTKDGSYFLITTMQKGSPVNIYSQPLNKQRIKAVLDSLFELDKAGIYHMDLNNNNILLDGNHANIIDYQWSKPFKPFNAAFENRKNGILFPEGIIPSNIHHYEETGFSSYLGKYLKMYGSSSARTFIKEYLPLKAEYFKKRVDYYKNSLIQSGEYYLTDEETGEITHKKDYYTPLKLERALSKVYENPNEDVVDVELLRLEVLRSHRKMFTFTDPNTDRTNVNILNAAPYAINGIFAIKNYLYNIDRLSSKYENDKYMSRYLRYNRMIADYWMENIKSWYPGTLSYLSYLAGGNSQEKVFPERNYIRHFSLTSFDDVLSDSAKRNKAQNTDPSILMPPKEMVADLEDNVNKLKNISGISQWEYTQKYPEYNDYDHSFAKYTFVLRDMIYDIGEALSQFKYAAAMGRPADAFSSLLVMKNLYSQLIGMYSFTSVPVQEVSDMANTGKPILDEITETLKTNIISTLYSDDKPINKKGDMFLTHIPKTKLPTEPTQQKSFIDKLMDWWDNL